MLMRALGSTLWKGTCQSFLPSAQIAFLADPLLVTLFKIALASPECRRLLYSTPPSPCCCVHSIGLFILVLAPLLPLEHQPHPNGITRHSLFTTLILGYCIP